jgi:hypothetical protein
VIEIKLVSANDEERDTTRALLARFRLLAQAARARAGLAVASRAGGDALALIDEQLCLLLRLDEEYGGSRPLPLADADQLARTLLAALAALDQSLRNAGEDALAADVDGIVVGAAFWALRHGLPVEPVEPVANALARAANAAPSRQALAATFGMMQGVIESVATQLGPDLERSNPERPWRILLLNLAITAIRTEDGAMIDWAFDRLDAGLPGECGGFYAEALARAHSSAVAPAVRERIAARHLKWTASH